MWGEGTSHGIRSLAVVFLAPAEKFMVCMRVWYVEVALALIVVVIGNGGIKSKVCGNHFTRRRVQCMRYYLSTT